MVGQSMGVVLNICKSIKKEVETFFFTKYQYFSHLGYYLIIKFINVLMIGGKKYISTYDIVSKFLLFLKLNFTGIKVKSILELFRFFEKLKDIIEIKGLRIGKKIYHIPTFNSYYRQYFKGLRSVRFLKKKKNFFNFWYILYLEWKSVKFLDGKSSILKNKEKIFFIAIDNRMFTHYRWK